MTQFHIHSSLARFTEQGSEMITINALQLSELLANGEDTIQLIDVREDYERSICHIGGKHIPLSLIDASIESLVTNKMTVVYCKAGGRSAQACQKLINAGLTQVANLEQGILGWIDTVDNSLMRY